MAELVPTDRSPDLATVTILSNGQAISQEIQIQTVSITRELNRIPFARLVLLDGDAAKSDFSLSGGDSFLPGTEIELKMGYHGEEQSLFKGIVIRHGIKARQNKPSILTIECRDKAVKMTLGRKTAFFYDSTDSDIAADLASAHGLTSDIQTTDVTHKEMVQYRLSDWDFMITRLEHNGLPVLVEDGQIQARRPDLNQSPALELTYGSSILDLEMEIDARTQNAAATAFTWDPARQERLAVAAESPSDPLAGDLDGPRLATVASPESLILNHGGARTEDELQAWSDTRILRDRLARICGQVSCQGFAIKPGQLLELKGVGLRFEGKVYVAGVRHEVTRGDWITAIQFGLDPKWHNQRFQIGEISPGLTGPPPGLHIGIATQLEEDPAGEHRILVKLPLFDPDDEGIWIRVATLDAGKDRGSFFLPEIGDEVVVGFLNGDARDGIMLGMLHSSAHPAPKAATDDNHIRGYVSRSGMQMLYDDENQVIQIDTPKGNKLQLSEADSGILIQDENGNKVQLNADGILLESPADIQIKATGDIKLEGTNVEIKASASFKADGGAGAEVTTSAVAVLKGSLVQIN